MVRLIIRRYTKRLIALNVSITVIKYLIDRSSIFVMIIHLTANPSRGGIPASIIMARKIISLGTAVIFALFVSLEFLVANGLILRIKMFQ